MTIIQEPDIGPSIYNITVHDTNSEDSEPFVFRTDGLINDDGAKSPLGRGTRVWRVARLVDGKLDTSSLGRVLKDAWVDEDRDREGKILENIINESESEEERQIIAALFLTPVVSGDVIVEGKPDSTRGCITGATKIPDTTLFPLQVPSDHKASHNNNTTSSNTQSPRIVPATEEQRAKILKYSQKQHHRIVFVEECVPLSKQTSLLQVFTCLITITEGML